MHSVFPEFNVLSYNCKLLMRALNGKALDDFGESLIRCMILVDIDIFQIVGFSDLAKMYLHFLFDCLS